MLGASAALSGLLLVFLGLVVSAYGGLDGDTPKAVKQPLRRTAWILLASFCIGLLCLAAATIWLVQLTGGTGLYVLTVGLFIAQLVSLAIGTGWTLRELLWD